MEAKVQIAPAGFLGLFQLKNFGAAPSPMLGNLQPVLDLADWYLKTNGTERDGLQVAAHTGTSVFSSWTTPVIVPQGEWWWIQGYRISRPVPAAGRSIDLKPTYRVGSTGNRIFALASHYEVGDDTDFMTWDMDLDPVWLPPGSELGYTVKFYAGGAQQLDGCIRYTRCPI